MKKCKAIVAGLVLTLSFSALMACGNTDNGTNTNDKNGATTEGTTNNDNKGNTNGQTATEGLSGTETQNGT